MIADDSGSVARPRARVRDARHNFLHKLSSTLVNENQVIGIEDLCVKGMQRGHLAKSVGRHRPQGTAPAAGLQDRLVQAGARRHRPLPDQQQALLGLRPRAGPARPVGQALGLPGLRGAPRPGRERGPEHIVLRTYREGRGNNPREGTGSARRTNARGKAQKTGSPPRRTGSAR